MKAIKIAGILLLALIVLVLVLNALAPKTFEMERSIVIDAPRETVFPYVQYLEQQSRWSPWSRLDPNMKTTLTGIDGTVGAASAWEGNKDVGKGSQTISLVQPYERVETQMQFIEPFESTAEAWLQLKDADNKATEVTWGFRSPMPFPFNIFGMIMGMEKEMDAQYTQGLADLKALVEKEAAAAPALKVMESTAATPRYYVGIRETVAMPQLAERMALHFPKIAQALQAAGIELDGMPSGLYFTWDEAAQTTDFAAAFPVKSKVEIKGFTTFEMPAGTRLSVDYYGPYEKIAPAHEAIDAYIQRNKWQHGAMAVEEYVTDPGMEPNPAKWLTKVTYPVSK